MMIVSSPKIYLKSSVDNQQEKNLLEEKLDWLTVDHDDLRQDLLERLATPKYHPSMAIIDQWEQETIAHIQQTAILARRTLIDALDQHVLEVKNTLNTLTPKLRQARNNTQSFNENDIQQWATMLQELKQIPVFPITIDKENHIYGLTIDLRKETRTHHSASNHDKSIPHTFLSILRDPIASSSICDTIEYQIPSTNFTKQTTINNKKVNFDDNTSSIKSSTVTPGGVIIIRESTINEISTTDKPIRRAHAEIPFDWKTNYPLRGPATVYH